MHSYTFHREVSCPRLWLPVLPVLPVPAVGHVAPRGSRSSDTAPDRPEPAAAAEPAVGRVAPRGSWVGFLFSDGRQREGTVLGLPWPAGHRWQHWRRVRVDGGGVCDVDSMHVAFAVGRAVAGDAVINGATTTWGVSVQPRRATRAEIDRAVLRLRRRPRGEGSDAQRSCAGPSPHARSSESRPPRVSHSKSSLYGGAVFPQECMGQLASFGPT